MSDSEFNTAQYNLDPARGFGPIRHRSICPGAHRNLGLRHRHQPRGRRRARPSPGQFLRTRAVPHRGRPDADADPRGRRRERYRPDRRGSNHSIHGAGLSRRHLHRHRTPGAPAIGLHRERGQLHRGGRRGQPRGRSAARHDRHGGFPGGDRSRRAVRGQRRAALQARPGNDGRRASAKDAPAERGRA